MPGEEDASTMTTAGTTTPAQDHALPYRILFEEYAARRGDADFLNAIQKWQVGQRKPSPADVGAARELLAAAIQLAETAYSTLRETQALLRETARKRYQDKSTRQTAVDIAHQVVLAAQLACQAADAPLKQLMHQLNGSAVCFSGGGIRSASYSLGVLQGLSRFSNLSPETGFMQRLDYLSTVSGGGYIGSWLMSWAWRSSFKDAISELGSGGKTAGDPEPEPVRHLRDFTSYLAPKYGLSVDTATLGSIFLRNLFLNWIIFLPSLMVLLLAPRLLEMIGRILVNFVINLPGRADQTLMWSAALFIAIAGWIAAYRAWQPPSIFGQSSELRSENVFLGITGFSAWLIVEAWWAGWADWPEHYRHFDKLRVEWLFLDLVIASLPMSIGRLWRAVEFGGGPFRTGTRWLWGKAVWSVAAPVLASAIIAVLLETIAVNFAPMLFGLENDEPSAWFNAIAFPVTVSVLMLGSALLTGLLSSVEQEEEREWWARAGGVLFLVMFAWAIAQLFGWLTFSWSGDPRIGILTWGAASAASGSAAAAAGKSASSVIGAKHMDFSQVSRAGRFLAQHQMLPAVLSALALACIFLLVGSLNEYLITTLSPVLAGVFNGRDFIEHTLTFEGTAILLLGAAAALLAWSANYCINVNTFSLHGMYRLRLVRAFLGASNFGRDADRFTNFDRNDNLAQADLQTLTNAPIHVVNTSLNLVHVRKSAWQQRKAESFTFTPFQCGSWRVGYAQTQHFGGRRGVTLGTAMAISGAAFNPNMGYNSSPLVTLVMTLFNARLGWWMPNPGWAIRQQLSDARLQDYLRKPGPTYALASILSEALGKTDDRRKWIQLSDGGHFENLGLYEMVLRRCRYIVAVDADADRTFQGEDLGNALRKIQIDLGIPITFPGLKAWPFQAEVQQSNLSCAVGRIEYCCVDLNAPPGYLIYLKPCLNGLEPRDVAAYASTHESFPHETTANQFFSEDQFESYRHLGSEAVEAILGGAKTSSLDTLLNAAFTYTGQVKF
jgi:hypothetical protein